MKCRNYKFLLFVAMSVAIFLLFTACQHEHGFGEWITEKQATCTEKGIEVRTCECGEKETREIIVEHVPGAWHVDKEPSCSEEGQKRQVCSVCSSTIETEVISKISHGEGEWITEKEATCSEEGYMNLYCLVCWEVVDTESIAPLEHIEGEWTTEKVPTCDEDGYMQLYCLVCGDAITTKTIPSSGHVGGEWVLLRDATRTENGTMDQKCLDCGMTIQTRELESTGTVFLLAEEKSSKEQYLEAISVLKDYIASFYSNPEVVKQIDTYGGLYVKQQIKKAEDSFIDPKADYEKSEAIIKAALQYYPANAQLLSKLEYYRSFYPVYLSDVKPYAQSYWFERADSVKDIFDNRHYHCVRLTKNFQSADGTYNLDRKYNTLSFTIFGLGDARRGSVKIYADGICIYSNTNIDPNTRPIEVSLDVTGVLDLKFEFYQDMVGYTGECFGLGNVSVQKTKK